MAGERALDGVLDLLGRRWAMRLVWELRRNALSFSELREHTGISPSVLSARLGELAAAGILERDALRRYRLSGHGRELARILYELNRWAEQNQSSRA
ncbi:MAG TPA: helix-turn-helix domain-containing protein [Solirubrobacterales bacterium]|jgi:DNA-binding HxlR family transcriptional regulator|nr:helix-turn-helix domain-containing protein [Solirubrobacterales bacterium]